MYIAVLINITHSSDIDNYITMSEKKEWLVYILNQLFIMIFVQQPNLSSEKTLVAADTGETLHKTP